MIAKRSQIEKCQGLARSLSLDLYDQWHHMEINQGKWRFTSPTHTVRAFYQALIELEQEGGLLNGISVTNVINKTWLRVCAN